jgi:hypothetical protein
MQQASAAVTSDIQECLVRLLSLAEQREAQLEAAYVAGIATLEQLEELEKIRGEMDEFVIALDDMGYFNHT